MAKVFSLQWGKQTPMSSTTKVSSGKIPLTGQMMSTSGPPYRIQCLPPQWKETPIFSKMAISPPMMYRSIGENESEFQYLRASVFSTLAHFIQLGNYSGLIEIERD